MTVKNLAQSQDDGTEVDAKICIIGAGMAGLTLTHSLASKGLDVLLLESGDTEIDGEAESLNEIDNANGRWTGALRSRCRGIGGTSRRWGGRTIPISATETAPRPYLGCEGWPFPISDLDRHTRAIEQLLALDASSYEADLYDKSAADDADFRTRWAKWPAFANCNLATRLHSQVVANPRVTIWTNATVTGVSFDAGNGRLKSVTASHQSGKQITVRATRFVLAAGTIESTRLMLWMARQTGTGLGNATPLGRYFQDHLNLKAARLVRRDITRSNDLFGYRFVKSIRRSLHLELSPQAQADGQAGSAFAYISMDLERSALGSVKKIARGLQQGRVDAAEMVDLSRHGGLVARSLFWRYVRQRLYVPTSVDFNVEICAEQAPDWDNSITLSDRTDRHGVPLARIQWAPKAADEHTLRVSVERLNDFWLRSGWHAAASLAWLPPVEALTPGLAAATTDYFHPSGTTRMGNDASTSVVSSNLTSHHVPNLSVLSASVFPRAGSANPTFTLLRMSLRLGDYLEHNLA